MSLAHWLNRFLRKGRTAVTSHTLPPVTDLREYLFLDERRLNAYVEQVHAPVTWDKVPQWGVELSLAGPRATGQQMRPARALTNHEKLQILVDYLKTTQEYASGRASDPTIYSVGPVFRSETCEATCLYLPSRAVDGDKRGGFCIWISEAPVEPQTPLVRTIRGQAALPGRLFLLEDDPHPDEPSPSYFSAFSTLKMLSEVFVPRLLWTPSAVDSTVRDFDRDFTQDPIAALRRLGATLMTSRWITTLYRIRTGTEMVLDTANSRVVTFAYPIAILSGHVHL